MVINNNTNEEREMILSAKPIWSVEDAPAMRWRWVTRFNWYTFKVFLASNWWFNTQLLWSRTTSWPTHALPPPHDVTQHRFGHEWNSHNKKKKDENGARGWRRQINSNFLAAYQDARRLSIIIISTCCANAHLFELLGKPRALCEITAPSGVPSFGTHICTFEYIIKIHFFARRMRMELESIRGILITI